MSSRNLVPRPRPRRFRRVRGAEQDCSAVRAGAESGDGASRIDPEHRCSETGWGLTASTSWKWHEGSTVWFSACARRRNNQQSSRTAKTGAPVAQPARLSRGAAPPGRRGQTVSAAPAGARRGHGRAAAMRVSHWLRLHAARSHGTWGAFGPLVPRFAAQAGTPPAAADGRLRDGVAGLALVVARGGVDDVPHVV